MILTEAEAAKRLCPFAYDFNANRTHILYENTPPRCAGSECMAWDWLDTEIETKAVQVRGEFASPEEMAPAICDQFGEDWTYQGSRWNSSSSMYWPPHDEQAAAWRAAGASYDSSKLTSVAAANCTIQRPRLARHGECKRTVAVREAD